jgi:hypothetical protein
MKKLLFAALWIGMVCTELKSSAQASPAASGIRTQGEEFIDTVTAALKSVKPIEEKLASFERLIKPHYTNFWGLINARRRQEDEDDLSLEEFFSHIFPTPISSDWPKPAIQLWLLYTTYLLIQDPEIIDASLQQDTRYAIRDYITHHDLSGWACDTINPLAPHIVNYFMLPFSKVSEWTRAEEDNSTSASSSNSL